MWSNYGGRVPQVETAHSRESNYVAPLLGAVRVRSFSPVSVAMDMSYDNKRVYAECAERDCAAIVPLRRGQRERDLYAFRARATNVQPLPSPLRASDSIANVILLARLSTTLARARLVGLGA
jgi:hypothetical protein